jgi:plasmid stabilization system protein ParE
MWYEEERTGLGVEFLDDVEHLLARIDELPLMFPVVESEVRRSILRRFPYSIYFTTESPQTTILAVLHLRRNPAVWKARILPG